MSSGGGAEPGELGCGFGLPFDENGACGRIHERPPQHVAFCRWQSRPVGPECSCRPVGGKDVPAASGDVGRVRVEAVDEVGDSGSQRLHCAAGGGWRAAVDEFVQVDAFGGAQAQGAGQRVEDLT